MQSQPKAGAAGEQKSVVEATHAIDFAEGGMPPRLCTPWLIWLSAWRTTGLAWAVLSAGRSARQG
jgi:hypothetical protein